MLFILFNLPVLSFAETISGLQFLNLDISDLDILLRKGEYSRIHVSSIKEPILQNHPFSREIEKTRDSLKSTTSLELLYLWNTRKKIIEKENLFLFLFNIMHKISSIKGITYYSASARREKILFTDASVIRDPENPVLLSDPEYEAFPEHSSLYARFIDTRFGPFFAEIQYRVYEDSLCLSFKNITPLYMLQHLKVAPPEALQIHIAVFPGKEEYLFYGFASADLSSLPGFQKSKEESLYNRLTALKNWFFIQLEGSN